MKRFLFIFLLIVPFFVQSQSMFEISGYGKVGSDIRSNYFYNGGVAFEWQPKSKNLGLNYSLRFGQNLTNEFEFQCPVGAITGLVAVAVIANSEDYDLSGLGLLLCFIPEGVSYNIWIDDGLALTPYINPLLIDVTQNDVKLLVETGAKLKIFATKHIFGAVDLCLQSPYDYKIINSCAGLSVGVRF